jgi:hypothetical protein
MRSYNPQSARTLSLGFSLFARHYSGNHSIIFFSSAYLDVSVQRVGSPFGVLYLQYSGLSHSEIWGSNTCVQFPPAYRSLPRPSSPLRAKASTMRP